MPATFAAARPRAGLTDIDPATIACWGNCRTGRAEIRNCRSVDGVWAYTRHEDAGTTWTVTHLPTGRTLPGAPSLPTARLWTADGWALRQLDRAEAERTRPMCSWRSPNGTGAICTRRTDGGERCDRHPIVVAAFR